MDMADIIHAKTGLSLADLMAMGSDARVEIIDGELVEMAAGGHVNGIIGANCIRLLGNYLEEKPIGVVMQDATTYLMFSNQRRLRDSFVPDVSFIFHENVPPDWDPTSMLHPGVPDLAIEIVSPTDNPDEVLRKRQIYLQKGTREVWILYPGAEE
ncbi:MAG: Uma2 family endonuclease, partial [Anaerolineae bacterium]